MTLKTRTQKQPSHHNRGHFYKHSRQNPLRSICHPLHLKFSMKPFHLQHQHQEGRFELEFQNLAGLFPAQINFGLVTSGT